METGSTSCAWLNPLREKNRFKSRGGSHPGGDKPKANQLEPEQLLITRSAPWVSVQVLAGNSTVVSSRMRFMIWSTNPPMANRPHPRTTKPQWMGAANSSSA